MSNGTHEWIVPRLVIAGTSSGVGKTTVTVGICRALRARGLNVAVFKCGPDYLDPTYHRRAAGRPSQTLDGWMMGRDAVISTFLEATRGADVALVEGMMGLYDGESPTGDIGSTAELAKWLEAPVLLVVDAGGVARSVAAMVTGFVNFDPAVRVAGVVCNRVGGPGHVGLLRQAQQHPPIWGGFSSEGMMAFPERHLGLRTADERAVSESLFDHWGTTAGQAVDIDAVLAAARSAPPLAAPAPLFARPSAGGVPRRCRIGIAFDEAFHFYYQENLRLLERAGAELIRFSPIADHTLPDVDGIYIGGGYPEAHSARLADNVDMRRAVGDFARRGGAVYAECGGLMYLAAGIETLDGALHPMVGLLPEIAVMSPRLEAIGYVEVETRVATPLGPPGTAFRGHQFRYSRLEVPRRDQKASEVALAYAIRRRGSAEPSFEGFLHGNTLASYVHAHWASNPEIAESFVAACMRFRMSDTGRAAFWNSTGNDP